VLNMQKHDQVSHFSYLAGGVDMPEYEKVTCGCVFRFWQIKMGEGGSNRKTTE